MNVTFVQMSYFHQNTVNFKMVDFSNWVSTIPTLMYLTAFLVDENVDQLLVIYWDIHLSKQVPVGATLSQPKCT